MQIEDLTTKLMMTTSKLKAEVKKANKLEEVNAKYYGINISELHNQIRQLQNQVELYKNNHFFKKNIEETYSICTMCQNQIDANNKR